MKRFPDVMPHVCALYMMHCWLGFCVTFMHQDNADPTADVGAQTTMACDVAKLALAREKSSITY